jgi:hypothetical protein
MYFPLLMTVVTVMTEFETPWYFFTFPNTFNTLSGYTLLFLKRNAREFSLLLLS